MNLITSAQAQDHITPRQDSHWHKAWMQKESCIFEGSFTPTIVTNNEIRIGEGVGSHQGRFFDVESGTYDTVTINNGTQGENRIDIVCQKITVNTSGGTQSGSWEVIQGTSGTGTPVAPTVPTADLDAGDTVSYMPVLMVTLNGLNIASIDVVADVWSLDVYPTIQELKGNYIESEGLVSGGWYTRRWSNGRMEAWVKVDSPQWGNAASANGVTRRALENIPTMPPFSSIDAVNVSGLNSGVWVVGGLNSNNSLIVNQYSISGTTIATKVTIEVKGWQ